MVPVVCSLEEYTAGISLLQEIVGVNHPKPASSGSLHYADLSESSEQWQTLDYHQEDGLGDGDEAVSVKKC